MYSNILVPAVFDHGDKASDSLKVATTLLNPQGTITLLHVMEEIPSYATTYLPEDLGQKRLAETEQMLSKMAADAGVEAASIVVQGHASASILEYADANDADCIVIASHKPGLGDYFLGSTAARVVRHAKCGVHILR